MFETFLFWFFLFFPGYALCRWQKLDDLKIGFLGACATSYLASFFLLSPISILAYWLELPLWVFSLNYLAFVIGAIIVIVIKGWWRELSSYSSDSPVADVVILLILFFFLYGSMMSGPFQSGDAWFHISRIRFLLVNGVSNADPFIGKGFSPWYHTNVYHVLFASGVQLTRVELFDFWYYTLPWAKFIIGSGIYFFAFVIFRNKWIAWIAAFTYLGSELHIDYNLYPNQLAPLWLLPVGLAYAVSCFNENNGWRDIAKLAICSFVIGEVHSLYGLFLWYVVAGCSVALLSYKIVRKQPGKYRLIQCILAVSIAIPFPAISKYKTVQADNARAKIEEQESANRASKDERKFATPVLDSNKEATGKPDATDRQSANHPAKEERVPEKQALDGNKREDATPALSHEAWRNNELEKIKNRALDNLGTKTDNLLLLIAIILGLYSRQRKTFGILLIITIGPYIVTLVPVLRGLMLDSFGRAWIVNRMMTTTSLCQHVIFVGGLLICFADFATRQYVKTFVIPLLIVLTLLSAIAGDVSLLDYPRWFEKLYNGFLSENADKADTQRKAKLLRKELLGHVPEGSVILANDRFGYHMTASFSAKLVYTGRNIGLIPDLDKRKRDLEYLLSKDTDINLRRKLFQRYGIKYWVYIAPTIKTRRKNAWTTEYGKVLSDSYGVIILQIE
jgi:hypothetical protein